MVRESLGLEQIVAERLMRERQTGRAQRRDSELERLTSATGRSKSWLINEALRSYVANEQQFLVAIENGKQALRDGKVVDHATVVEAFERIVKPHP